MAGQARGDDDKGIKKVILESIEACTVCGRALIEDDLRVLGHDKDTWFLVVVCHNCSTQGLIAAQVKELIAGKELIGKNEDSVILTELTNSETNRYRSATPLASNDVLDMHQFLQTFNGDFATFFGATG
jgi:hypothetical protein